MSLKQVVPPRSISTAARRVPARTNPASTNRASAGQTCSESQVSSGTSSARPRNRVIAAWVWALTSPGVSACPSRCTRSRGENRASISSAGPSAAMAPPCTASAWSSRTRPAGSTGTIHEALSTRSADSPFPMARILDPNTRSGCRAGAVCPPTPILKVLRGVASPRRVPSVADCTIRGRRGPPPGRRTTAGNPWAVARPTLQGSARRSCRTRGTSRRSRPRAGSFRSGLHEPWRKGPAPRPAGHRPPRRAAGRIQCAPPEGRRAEDTMPEMKR